MNIFRTRKFREEKFSDIKSIKVPEEFKVISEREYDKDVKVKSNPQNEFMNKRRKCESSMCIKSLLICKHRNKL